MITIDLTSNTTRPLLDGKRISMPYFKHLLNMEEIALTYCGYKIKGIEHHYEENHGKPLTEQYWTLYLDDAWLVGVDMHFDSYEVYCCNLYLRKAEIEEFENGMFIHFWTEDNYGEYDYCNYLAAAIYLKLTQHVEFYHKAVYEGRKYYGKQHGFWLEFESDQIYFERYEAKKVA